MQTIREPTLRELIKANSIGSALAVGQFGGFALAVQCGDTQRYLGSTRGSMRIFPNLNTLTSFLRKLGISRFEVDAGDYRPGRVRAARPDRAEALRRTRTQPRQGSIFEGSP